jgi:16S rRNA processing protein RimM
MRVGADDLVTLGTVSGVHGVRGWIKVRSFTQPRDNIATYREWQIPDPSSGDLTTFKVEAARTGGRQLCVKLAGIDDRDRAAGIVGRAICVARSELPACDPGEYYWTDLEGLRVRNLSGEMLGEVSHLIDTGAHAVLVLAGDARRMIPFVAPDIVESVDLEAGVITVDWEESYWD